jgi:hypothetical protein
MAAVTETVPVSAPMVSVTGTGFTVPVKLAFVATAVKAYRFVPVGLIPTVKSTPLITPWKENEPAPVKERDGMVAVKVPTWRVTGSAGGLIPLLALPNVKFDESSNKIGVWRVAELDQELGAEDGEGYGRDEPDGRR